MMESQKQMLKFIGEVVLWAVLWVTAFVGIVLFVAEVLA